MKRTSKHVILHKIDRSTLARARGGLSKFNVSGPECVVDEGSNKIRQCDKLTVLTNLKTLTIDINA